MAAIPPDGYVFTRDVARMILEESGIKYVEMEVYNLSSSLNKWAIKNNFKKKIGFYSFIPKNKVEEIKRSYPLFGRKKLTKEYIFENCFNNPYFKPRRVRLEKRKSHYPSTNVEVESSLSILGREEEVALFREYNWCKFKACMSKKKLEQVMNNGESPEKIKSLEKEIEDYYNEIGEIKREASSAHAGFVIKTALFYDNRYKQDNLPLGDLIAEGYSALLEKMDRFDHRRGYKYLSYVGKWINKRIQDFINHNNGLYVPLDKVGISKETLEARSAARNVLSLDYNGPKNNKNEDAYGERINLEGAYSQVEAEAIKNWIIENYITTIKKILSEREYDILLNYYSNKKIGERLARKYGISRERIRQIRNSALTKVKEHPKILRILRENQFFGNPLFRQL